MKIIRVTCRDDEDFETSSKEVIDKLNKVIPGLKWNKDVVGLTAEKKTWLHSNIPYTGPALVSFRITIPNFFARKDKVIFSLNVISEYGSEKNKKNWTTTYKQAITQANKFYELYKGWIKNIEVHRNEIGEKMTIKEE